MIQVERPAPEKRKISSKEDFELCYLRHQYLRKAKGNPTIEEMTPYMKIVENLSKNTFFTYYNLFKTVGMYMDDVVSIGQVHLVSFLNLFALEKMPEKMDDWILNKWLLKGKGQPQPKDFLQQNRANFSIFYKQRMEDLVRICKQKLRNIKGQSAEEYLAFIGKSDLPRDPTKLIKDHEEYGFKKLDFTTFKKIRKRSNVKNNVAAFKFGDSWYVCFPIPQRDLEIEDLIASDVNPYLNTHNRRPDQVYNDKEAEKFEEIFNNKSNDKKMLILKKFIAKNRNKSEYSKEVSTARKLLKTIGA
jgi:hypothetical protein